MSKTVMIQALNTDDVPISNLKDKIKLYLHNAEGNQTISCIEEKENGVYIFDINDSCDRISKVTVGLSEDVVIDSVPYHREPFFLHPSCYQINFLECMVNTDKIISFYFSPYENTPVIGVIKAYKLSTNHIQSCNSASNGGFDNTEASYKGDWNNEIYCLDTNQNIRLQAFISNNITDKTLKNDINGIDFLQIRWGYKITKSSKETSLDDYPSIIKEKDITSLEGKFGANIILNLHDDIIAKGINITPNKHIFDNSGHNIIIFAYTKDKLNNVKNLGYRQPKKTAKDKFAKTIQCIELKIIESRFCLRYDGETLELLENKRVIQAIKDSPHKELAKFLSRYAQTIQDDNAKSTTPKSSTQEAQTPQDTHIFRDGYYTICKDNASVIAILKEADSSYQISDKQRNALSKWAKTYREVFGSVGLKEITLIVEYKKDIVIEVKRYYENIHLTMSRFRVLLSTKPTCPKHAKEYSYISHSCKNCEDLQRQADKLAQWEKHYFLERSGPDCITPNLGLRIPEGRYDVSWRKSGVSLTLSDTFKKLIADKSLEYRKPVIHLNNPLVASKRDIMLHQGNEVKDSQGCLLFGNKIAGDEAKPKGIEKGCSTPMAQELLDFLIQNPIVKKAFYESVNGFSKQIPNISFIITNAFGDIKEE